MRIAQVLSAAASVLLLAWSAPCTAQDPLLVQCLTWVHEGGYPTGIDQGHCEAHFDLPDPFTLRCARRTGFDLAETEKLACELHLLDLIGRTYEDFVDAERLCLIKGADRCGS